MPSCVLRVSGDSFDPEVFLKTSHLSAYRIWQRGEPLGKTGHRATVIYKDSGFCCDVSAVDGDLRGQLKDAEEFLKVHRADFEDIASNPTVQDCQLDFGIWCRIGEKQPNGRVPVTQFEYLPVSFLQLVGQLRVGIAISLYPREH